ncbi:peptidoglycan recognition family protein [Streptomyces sp. NBRC 109706]|uniref:peptidoglycan recognition protein family protein n=1 Tax=Streptomyces sp. NBRC 109706 TaxID=1550035 RepID=UPI00078076BB|nr:peptidoglycan recognition family protein [Streptomyces sp. NBRC 109706]
MDFVSRAQWGAPATSPAAALATAKGVAVHWLGATYTPRDHAECAAYVRSIRASHLANKVENYLDIAYNLLVCHHGYVYEGRGVRKRSGANGTTTANANHYAVCALWAKSSGPPPDALKAGLRDAIDYLRDRGAGNQLTGHRDHRATECPGDALYAWVRAGALRPGPTTPPATEQPKEGRPMDRYYEKSKPLTLKPNVWTTVTWDRVHVQGTGWNEKKAEQTLLKGAHAFILGVGFRVDGMERGEEVQVRIARNHRKGGEDWKRAKSWPIGSPVQSGGRGHFVHTWPGMLPGTDDNRLVVDLLNVTTRDLTVDELVASLLAWPA